MNHFMPPLYISIRAPQPWPVIIYTRLSATVTAVRCGADGKAMGMAPRPLSAAQYLLLMSFTLLTLFLT